MGLMGNEGLSIADAMALANNNNNDNGMGMFGGNGSWVFFLFFLLAWGNNGIFGGNGGNAAMQGALTRADLNDGFNFSQLQQSALDAQKGLCEGFYAQNADLMHSVAGIQRDISGSTAALQSALKDCCCNTQLGIADLGHNLSTVACGINRNIDAVRYENAQNTTAIVNAIKEDGATTRALMNATAMQELRDKISDKERQLQTANFMLSQQAQNATLIDAIKPCPIPAYPVCSPYTSANCCGCN